MEKLTHNDSVLRIGQFIENSEKSYLSIHKARQRINIADNNVFYIKKGNVNVHTGNGGFVVFTVSGPEIVGIEKTNSVYLFSHLRCTSDAEIYIINATDLITQLNTHNLWIDAFIILSRYMEVYNARDFMIHQPTAKNTVMQYLTYLWILPPKKEILYQYLHLSQKEPI